MPTPRLRLGVAILVAAAIAAFAATASAATVDVYVDCTHDPSVPLPVPVAADDTLVIHMNGTTCPYDDGWEVSNVNGHFDASDMTGSPKTGPDGFGLSTAPGYLRYVSTTGDHSSAFMCYLYRWSTLGWTTGVKPTLSPFGPDGPLSGFCGNAYADWYVWAPVPGRDWTVTTEVLAANGVASLADGTFVAEVDNTNGDAPNAATPIARQIALVVGAATTRELVVTKAGAGSGTVTSAPAGIDCGTTCSAAFAVGASVALTATAASGSTFAGWSGACSGTGTCTVAMSDARAVTATFNAATAATGSGAAPTATAPAASGSGASARVVLPPGAGIRGIPVGRDGSLRLRIACPAGAGACRVSGTIALRGARRGSTVRGGQLGSFADVDVAAGRTRTIVVQLRIPLVRALQRAGASRRVDAVIALRSARGGATATSQQAVALRLPRAAPLEPITG